MFGWDKQLAAFKIKLAEFEKAYDFLMTENKAFSNNPALSDKRTSLLSSASIIESSIAAATSAIDEGKRIIDSTAEFFGFSDTGLGIAPLAVGIPLSIVAASTAAITRWLTSFDRLRADMYKNMIAEGVPPTEAARRISGVKPQRNPITDVVVTLIPLLGLGLYLYKGKKQ